MIRTHNAGLGTIGRGFAHIGRACLAIGLLGVAILAAAACKGETDSVPRSFQFHGLHVVSVEKSYPEGSATRDGTTVSVRFELQDEQRAPINEISADALSADGVPVDDLTMASDALGRLQVAILLDGTPAAHNSVQKTNAVRLGLRDMLDRLEAERPDGFRVTLHEFADSLAPIPGVIQYDASIGSSRQLYAALADLAVEADEVTRRPLPEVRSSVIVLITAGPDEGSGTVGSRREDAIGALRQRGVAVHIVELGDGQSLDGAERRAFDIFTTLGEAGSYQRVPETESIGSAIDTVTDRLLSTYVVDVDTAVMSGTHSASLLASADSRNGRSDPFAFDAGTANDRPATPSGLEVVSVGTDQVALRWNAVMDAQAYQLEQRPAGSGPEAWLPVADGDNTFGTDTGLSAGTEYEYRVRSANTYGASDWSAVLPTITICSAPVGLVVPRTGFFALRPEWSATQGAAEYEVQRRVGLDPVFSTVSVDPATSYQDSGLPIAATVRYRVRALNASGESAWSAVGLGTTAPAPPGNLRPTRADDVSIDMAWNPVVGATEYELQYAESTAGPWTGVAITSGLSATQAGLSASTIYWFRIRAVNLTPWSTFRSATTGPPIPTGLRVVDLRPDSVTLDWNASTGTSGYEIRRATMPTGPWSVLSQVSSPGYVDSSVAGATTYYYQVRSTAGAPTSRWSASVSVTTPDEPIAAPRINAFYIFSYQQLDVGASTYAFPVIYEFQRALSSTGPWTTLTVGSEPRATSSGQSANTTYYFRVRAMEPGDAFWSDWSTVANYTTTEVQPLNFRQIAATTTSFTMAWDAVTAIPVSGYEIQEMIDFNAWSTVATLGASATSHQITGLSAGFRNTYRVRSTDPSGNSEWMRRQFCTRPDAPIAVFNVGTETGTTADLFWYEPLGASESEIQRSTNGPGGPWTTVDTVSQDNYTDSGLNGSQTYHYRIRHYTRINGGQTALDRWSGAWSDYAVQNGAPLKPTGLSATNVRGNTVTLSWSAVAGATGYEVRVFDAIREEESWIAYTGSALTTDWTIPDGTRSYEFTVRATNGSGHGNWAYPLVPFTPTFWVESSAGTSETLLDIWAAGPNDVFAVGGGGVVRYFNGTTWTGMTTPTTFDLHGVWGTSATNVYAVGANHQSGGGVVIRYNGTSWTTMYTNSSWRFLSIAGRSASDIYVTSTGGRVAHFDGTSWTILTAVGTSSAFVCIEIDGPTIYMGGGGGEVVTYDGSTFSADDTGVSAIYDIEVTPGGIIAIGRELVRNSGSGWVEIPFPNVVSGTIRAMSATSFDDFIYTGAGEFFRYSTSNVAHEEPGSTAEIMALHRFANGEVWGCGESGAIVVYTP